MTDLRTVAQSLSPDAIIALFTLDATNVGGTILRFTASKETGGYVYFGGDSYIPIDISFEGLETSGVGAPPTPTVRISNTDGIVQSLLNTWGDLTGAMLYRRRTFARFLDGHAEADSGAFFGPDVYSFDRKTSDKPTDVTWELSTTIDQQGRMIPGRVAIRSTCMWRYRSFIDGSFNYEKAQCPYTGANFFDENDEPTTYDKDVPSRTINCCKVRFGEGQPLPFGGFPGVGRVL